MEEEVILKKPKNIIKRKNLNYLGFHKFLGMYLIIRMHLYSHKTMPFDYGIRMCELLFISSGFLVGYNYYQNPMEPTFKSSFKYAYKHLRSFYPYYLINFLYGLYFFKNLRKFDLTYIELFLINILMISNWSSHRKIASFYFGISWFLDNILYCYFISPLLLISINNLKNSLKCLFFTFLARILVEEFLNHGAYNVFDTNFHCGPIIRILEFYIGMLLSPLFLTLKAYLDKFQNKFAFKIISTIIQIISPIYLCYIMIKCDKIIYRCYFILIISTYVFIISFDYGFLSSLVGTKIFRIVMSAQLEMYLIQINVNITFEKYFGKINRSGLPGEIIFFTKLMIIFIISYFYRKFFREKLAILMDKIIFFII
jgi:peptidoglycan/LPS O-acetylase OafA/YrhL